MADSGTRLLSVLPSPVADEGADDAEPALEPGLADVVTLQRRKDAAVSENDEQSFFLDTIAEYQWARDAAGLAPATLDGLTKPVLEVCQHYGLTPWRLAPRHVGGPLTNVSLAPNETADPDDVVARWTSARARRE